MEETCSSCCTGLIQEGPEFNLHFADYGWCAYDSISEDLVHRANLAYEEQGIEAAERILIDYYQNEAPGQIDHILGAAPSFSMREGMIRQCFEDHRERRYYASVPLALIIIDGAVNDYTKKKGFFNLKESWVMRKYDAVFFDLDGTLTESHPGITRSIKYALEKHNMESPSLDIPYRNGILHGRDINYGNEYVSCKCIALMFAIADWMIRRTAREEGLLPELEL